MQFYNEQEQARRDSLDNLKRTFAILLLTTGVCVIAWVFATPGTQIWQTCAGGLMLGFYVRLSWRK